MQQVLEWMMQQFNLSSRDAKSLWKMMEIDAKNKGADLNKIPPDQLMRFMKIFMANMNKGAV